MPMCLFYVFAYMYVSIRVGAQVCMCMKKSEDKLGYGSPGTISLLSVFEKGLSLT